MKDINLPPFYVGQKIVALVSSKDGQINKGVIYTSAGCVKPCCGGWDVAIKELPGTDYSHCIKCRKVLHHTGIFFLIGRASAFAPLHEDFKEISFEKVVEIEKEFICCN